MSGEYAGTSPWGQKFNAKFGYAGSTYTDDLTSYTVENPFCVTGALIPANPTNNFSLRSVGADVEMAPDNQANNVHRHVRCGAAVQEPLHVDRFLLEMMRQNQAFLPFTINFSEHRPRCYQRREPGQPTPPAALPAASLNGAINTILSNNVLTTQITPDLKSKASYRYYAYNNDTPEIRISRTGSSMTTTWPGTMPGSRRSTRLSLGYVKQNFAEELVWRPARQWNIGAAYGFERYDPLAPMPPPPTSNTAKAFLDWKPAVWVTARTSWVRGPSGATKPTIISGFRSA